MPITHKINNSYIDWVNLVVAPDGQRGVIRCLSTWLAYDLERQKLIEGDPTVLRDVLLTASHPRSAYAVGQVSTEQKNPEYLNSFHPWELELSEEERQGESGPLVHLDLASNSRNHGRFTFTNKRIGRSYFGADWKRIIYGSILHTGCKRLIYRQMKFIITDDELRDFKGEPHDDPVNGRDWNTGDSHATGSTDLMRQLGLTHSRGGDNPGDVIRWRPHELERPIQFRCAEFKKWVGKGTIAHNPALDGVADMAIPLSSLKGNKLPLGNYEAKLLIGYVHGAEQRRASPGWMLFQWFDFKTLEDDGIISNLETKAAELGSAFNSIEDLARILRVEQGDAESLDEMERLQSEAQYVNTMMNIVMADEAGILLLHPYVVRRVQERYRAMFLKLAKAAGVRFWSVMTMPDESLAHYWTQDSEGRIEGEKVFCAGEFPPGTYIVFANPMRHWGDIQLWQNKHEGRFTNALGVMAAPRDLLLSLGRDTDGDFVQLISADTYPAMAAAIANFTDTPNVEKFPKRALKGNLREIALGSMNDLTGIVASLLGKARAQRAENIVLEIPPGGEQTEPKQMRIIDFLSQELQVAVDSLKSAYPNNRSGLEKVSKFLRQRNAQAGVWIRDLKDPQTYLTRPVAVEPDAIDTVSKILQIVNSHWNAPQLEVDSRPRTYQNVLLGKQQIPFSDYQEARAYGHRDEYRAAMGQAIAWARDHDNDTSAIRIVAQATKESKQSILETLDPMTGDRFPPLTWASAYWHVAHDANTGDAGLVFMIFSEEIVRLLRNFEPNEVPFFDVFGTQYNAWAHPTYQWQGVRVQIRIQIEAVRGRQRKVAYMKWDAATRLQGWHLLGIVGEAYEAQVMAGQVYQRLAFTNRVREGVGTINMRLIDTKYEENNEYQMYL